MPQVDPRSGEEPLERDPAQHTLNHLGFAVSGLDRYVDFYDLLLREEPILRNVWDFGYVCADRRLPRRQARHRFCSGCQASP